MIFFECTVLYQAFATESLNHSLNQYVQTMYALSSGHDLKFVYWDRPSVFMSVSLTHMIFSKTLYLVFFVIGGTDKTD